MIRNSQKYCKMTDILTDKELQRLKILEAYFEENNYIDNSEAQKILNVSDSTERRFLNKLVKKWDFGSDWREEREKVLKEIVKYGDKLYGNKIFKI